MTEANISVAKVNFKNWQRAVAEITGFDNQVYWKKLEKNPDFDKKGLYRASLVSGNSRLTTAVISSHFVHAQGVINNLIIKGGDLSPETMSKVATVLIQVAITRLKKLDCRNILARIPEKNGYINYFENNGFEHHKTLVHMSKIITNPKKPLKQDNSINDSINVLKMANKSQISDFVNLNSQIFIESESEPLKENEINEWLLNDPSFALDQMFFVVDRKTGEKMGVGHFFYYPAENRGGIFGIGVKEEFRGQGIATKLINAIINDISRKGGNTASIECYRGTRAEKLYSKLGFEPDSIDVILKLTDI